MANLGKYNVLAKLEVCKWSGYAKDKNVAEAADIQFQTKKRAGNYNKRLLDPSVFKKINKYDALLRELQSTYTTPWSYDGIGMLPNKLILPVTAEFRALKSGFDNAADEFIQQYPVYKANYAPQLGKMYNEADYPSPEKLRSKFKATLHIFPVPAAHHFDQSLEGLEEDITEELKAQLEDNLKDTQREAVQSLYDRVIAAMAHVHDRLNEPQTIFRNSLITNLQQLADVLPALNTFNDPKLVEAHRRISSEMLICDAQDLRVDMPMRERTANAAFDIMNFLKGEDANDIPDAHQEATAPPQP